MDPRKNSEMINAYWENNIAGFSGFYDGDSEERLRTSPVMEYLYKKIIFPVEKKYMKDRYNLVLSFINKYISEDMEVADIGCGSGIYTKILARKCKKVYAIDFAQSALDLTKSALTQNDLEKVTILKQDILYQPMPSVDAAISIGVLPYIQEQGLFLRNILPYTNRVLFNFLDARNFFNLIRRAFPILNVRNYSYHNFHDVEGNLTTSRFSIISKYRLATGIIIAAVKSA